MLPNEAGAGFKLLGSKQWDRLVGYGSFTHTAAEGGGVSVTLARNTATAGAAYLTPLGIGGEIAIGLMWMQPHDLVSGIELRNQFGAEAYWKLSLTPNLWLTPGVQLVLNPSLNPDANAIIIPHVKFRIAL